MDLAGVPFHLRPQETLNWTLPQILFTWVQKREQTSADARQMFQLTMAAIGSVFAKDGAKMAEEVMATLEGGAMTADEVAEKLDDTAKLVLYGSKRLGRTPNTDPDTD